MRERRSLPPMTFPEKSSLRYILLIVIVIYKNMQITA